MSTTQVLNKFKLSDLMEKAERRRMSSPIFNRPQMAQIFRQEKWQRKMVRKMLRAHGLQNMVGHGRAVPEKRPKANIEAKPYENKNAHRRKRWRFWDIFKKKEE
jgi:hypothetical protein